MIAYLVLAHADPEALRRLINVLGSDARSRVYLHFDRKTPLPEWHVAAVRAGSLNLVPQLAVNWAGYSMICAMRSLIAAAMENPQVEQLVLLSGSSFPLRPMAEINDELLQRDRGLFALWKVVQGGGASATRRERNALNKLHLMDVAALNPSRGKIQAQFWKLWRMVNTALPYSRNTPGAIVKGSQWFCATRAEAVTLLQQDELDLRLRYSFAPDEMLFQTRWYRQQLAAGRLPDFVDETSAVQALHYIPNHQPPHTSLVKRIQRGFDSRRMTLSDIEPAIRSPALFARKCSSEVVEALLTCVTQIRRQA